jgi:hypothetical protein
MIDLRTYFWEHRQLCVALSRVTEPDNLCLYFPRSSELRCDIDPTETPIRLRVDVDIAQIISKLYSEVDADHVVSPDDDSPAMGQCSAAQYSVPVGLSDEYQGKMDDMIHILDRSQEVSPYQQTNDEILRSDLAIALDD